MALSQANLYAVIAVAALAVAAVGLCAITVNGESGPYMEYTISGESGGIAIDGKMRMTIIDETEEQYLVKTSGAMYITVEGIRQKVPTDNETEWYDKEGPLSIIGELGEKISESEIDTKWGVKSVHVHEHTDAEGDLKVTSYFEPIEGVIYKMVAEQTIEGFGVITYTIELSKTNMF